MSFFFEVVIKLTQKILAMGKTISCLPSPRKIIISIGGINKQFPVMGGKNRIVLHAIYIYTYTICLSHLIHESLHLPNIQEGRRQAPWW
jgi:hypothetical protein